MEVKVMRFFFVAMVLALTACGAGISATGGARTASVLPEGSTSQSYLYISEYGGGVLDVFSWPQAQYLRSISDVNSTPLMGLCTDKQGDLWVVESGAHPQAQEFSHAGSAIGDLNDEGEVPYGCAVDPKSGDFAMTSQEGVYDQPGSVEVWKEATGAATDYLDPTIGLMLWCGYDNTGDLFVDGLRSNGSGEFALAELPKGGGKLIDIKINGIVFPGAIQWVNGGLTIGDPSYKVASAVDRVAISGVKGSVTSRTVLKKSYEVFEGYVSDGMVIGPDDGPSISTVQLWKYPAGGKPAATLSKDSGAFNGPIGAVVSPPR
jgi:hypothetical protein